MQFGKHGVFAFADVLDSGQLTELAERVEALGYSTLWYPEATRYETFALGGYLLGASKKLVVASGIANIYARDATTAAMGHNSLNDLYGGRFVLGLGVSHPPLVADVRGHQYSKPVATMRAYLDGMERSWAALGSTPASKQIVLAALGPNMTRLAAERTLGSMPYNVTPEHVAKARKVMGSDVVICCEQKVCLCTDPEQARAAARTALSFYLPLPNYYNNWLRLGFTADDFDGGGSDRLMDAMVSWGDVGQIKAKLQAYFDAGADQVIIQPVKPSAEPGPDWAALEALAPAG